MLSAKCISVWSYFFLHPCLFDIFCIAHTHTHNHKRTTKREKEEWKIVKWFRKPRRTLKWILLNIRQNSKCSWRNVVKWETRFFSRGCERVREKCSAFVGFDYGWIAFFVCIRLLFYSNVYMLVSVYTSSSLNSWDFREFDFHLCAMWYDIFLSFWFGSFVCAMNLSHSAQYNSFELWSTLRQTIAKVYIYTCECVCNSAYTLC